MLCNLYTRGPLALLPSPCGKPARFPPKNIPGCAARSAALKLTYTPHFGRVLSSTSSSLTWPGPGPSVADASTLAIVGQRTTRCLPCRNFHGPVICKPILTLQRMRRRTSRSEAVASFLLSHSHCQLNVKLHMRAVKKESLLVLLFHEPLYFRHLRTIRLP